MAWDDELEQLTLQLHDLFSQDLINAAMRRALNASLLQARPIESSPVAALLEESGITNSNGTWTPMSAFHDALRVEFRRMLQPH